MWAAATALTDPLKTPLPSQLFGFCYRWSGKDNLNRKCVRSTTWSILSLHILWLFFWQEKLNYVKQQQLTKLFHWSAAQISSSEEVEYPAKSLFISTFRKPRDDSLHCRYTCHLQGFANTPKGRGGGKMAVNGENLKFTLLDKLFHCNKGIVRFLEIKGETGL